jgi:cyanate permease
VIVVHLNVLREMGFYVKTNLKKKMYAWIGLMTFLALLLTLRLIIWPFFIRKGKILEITPKSKDCKGEYSTSFCV